MTPTARTLAECRRLGLLAEVVERWVPTIRATDENGHERRHGVRKDLFGFIDLVCLDRNANQVVFIQATSGANVAHRKTKILTECRAAAQAAIAAGARIEIWGWKKYAKAVDRKFWRVRVEVVSAEELSNAH